MLASAGLRAWGKNPMCDAAREMIITASGDVRLLGFYSPQKSNRSKGLVVLLHGWEGSVASTYILCTGNAFYGRGYDIFRLNFRDHGDSHHLNQGIFYAVLLEEVFQAVHQLCRSTEQKPVFLTGFSLGGNFALRIARRCLDDGISPLKHVISISPVLDPDKATDKIDGNPFLLAYFMKKWKRSLRHKQHLFPDLYDFADILRQKNIRKMTGLLLRRYTDYPDTRTYFRSYGIYGHDLADIQIPTTIITAEDDPVIPVEDFHHLKTAPSIDMFIHSNGGHNGFVDSVRGPAWYDRFMLNKFSCPDASDET